MTNDSYVLEISVDANLIISGGEKGILSQFTDTLYGRTNNMDGRYHLDTIDGITNLKAKTVTAEFRKDFPIATIFDAIIATGGEVKGYPAILELDNPTVTVPDVFEYSTYTDDKGDEQLHTFETYIKSDSSYPIKYGDKYYIALDRLLQEPSYSKLVSLRDSIISIEDYKDIQAQYTV